MNKPRLAAFFWIFALFLLQNGIGLAFPGVLPALVITGVLFFALLEGPAFGFVLGCYAGIFFEIFGVGRMGFEILFFGLLGLAAGSGASAIFRDGWFAKFVFPVVAVYAASFFHLFTAKIGADEAAGPWLILESFSWPVLFWTAASSPAVFFFLRKVSKPAR